MRLFVADADAKERASLQLRLNLEPGMPVVGIADHTSSLLEQLAATKPDILLLDWYLPGDRIDDVLAELNEFEQRPFIIVLAVRPETESAAMAAGADAFCSKGAPPYRLVETLRKMMSSPSDSVAVVDG
jgi:DNA-binding NarL/FixJ family response regulator